MKCDEVEIEREKCRSFMLHCLSDTITSSSIMFGYFHSLETIWRSLKSWWMLKLMILIMLQIQARRQTSDEMTMHNGKKWLKQLREPMCSHCPLHRDIAHGSLQYLDTKVQLSRFQTELKLFDMILYFFKLTHLLTQFFKSCFSSLQKAER